GLLVLTFILVRVVPNDPSAALAGQNATAQQIAEIRAKYGFDQPLIVQFGIYLKQVVQADLGTSIQSGRPVARDIFQRLPATTALSAPAARPRPARGIRVGGRGAPPHTRGLAHGSVFFPGAGVPSASFGSPTFSPPLFAFQLDRLPPPGRPGTAMTPPADLT